MAPAPDDMVEGVRTGGLLVAGRPAILLLSGGRDSVCLLDVAVRILGPGVAAALHVNYGLRPDAAAEERHCAALCERLDVELTVKRVRPSPVGNRQAWARDVRYGEGMRLALLRGAVMASGHTATDQAETVLYRLAASPGRRALLGMAPRNGRLVRPLLCFTREQTADYCRARGLSWCEDASNEDPRYARARVRAALVPALRAVSPLAERNVVRTAELLREEAVVLDAVVADVLGDRASVSVARLEALPRALARLVVRRLAEDAAGRLVPAAAARLEELLALGRGGGAKSIDLADGARAVIEHGELRFVARADGGEPARPVSVEV